MNKKYMPLASLHDIVKQFGLLENKSFSKKLGQNFLLEEAIPRKIVETIGDIRHSYILEIGPGPGALTRELLKKKPQKIIAIEQDARCIQALQSLVNDSEGCLELIQGDATKIKQTELFKGKTFQIVANLPYNISTLLLARWMYHLDQIQSMTVMVQREVAHRIVAKVGHKDYGRLSVLCQWMCEVAHLFDVSPYAFTPPPKVFSSVIRLTPKPDTAQRMVPLKNLEQVTQTAFSKRRKMIRSSLGTLFEKETFQKHLIFLNIQETQRPETLTVEQFAYFASHL